jgi:hypothetical protein
MASSVNLVTIKFDEVTGLVGKLKRFVQAKILPKTMTNELDKYGRLLSQTMRREAPKRTTTLIGTIQYQIKKPNTPNPELVVTAGNSARPEVVVRTILFGSKPHVIMPKKKGGKLKFMGHDGKYKYRSSVYHPGTKPNNFYKRSWALTEHQRIAMIKRIGQITVDEIQK